MTKQEAMELENICDKLMSYYLKKECSMSLSLSGKLKVEFEDGDFINLNTKSGNVDYISFYGFYSDLLECIEKIQLCLKENKGIFDKLVWSYEHASELEE